MLYGHLYEKTPDTLELKPYLPLSLSDLPKLLKNTTLTSFQLTIMIIAHTVYCM